MAIFAANGLGQGVRLPQVGVNNTMMGAHAHVFNRSRHVRLSLMTTRVTTDTPT